MVRQPGIEYVPKYYEMDPSTEDLLFDGRYLQDGMVVLVGDQQFRGDPQATDIDIHEAYRIKLFNRWCSVSLVTTIGNSLAFMATYGDGTKHKMVCDVRWPWLVKLDSLPMQPVADYNLQPAPKHLEEDGDHTTMFRFRGEENKPLEVAPEWVGEIEKGWQAEKGTSTTGH